MIEDRISIIQGNIVTLQLDAIVNAANSALSGGGGVDGAIHRAAGPELLQECRQLGGCKTGQAKITSGYLLPAKYIIHTVGPVWYGGHKDEAELLASCYRESLSLAQRYQVKTICFPAISTGAYGFPLNKATEIAISEIQQYLDNDSQIEEVILVCFDKKTYNAYMRAIEK